MNIYTFKLNKKTFGILAAVVLVFIGLVITLVSCDKNDDAQNTVKLSEKEEMIRYIQSLGYEIDEERYEEKKVVIPSKFDDVYTNYNLMQKDSGFDLEKYKGKQVTLYTFGIRGYKDAEDVLCDLLVYKGKVIGGAVYTADVSGFMHGLNKIS